MFIRVKKIGPYEYLYLVENAREGGRHVQRVIKALGRRDEVENSDMLDGLIASAARHSRRSIVLSSFYRGELPELRRLSIGPDLVFGRLWQETGCADVLHHLLGERQFGFDVERAIYLTVLHRLMVSGSDRHAHDWHQRLRIQGADDPHPEAGLQGNGLARRANRRRAPHDRAHRGSALPPPPAAVRRTVGRVLRHHLAVFRGPGWRHPWPTRLLQGFPAAVASGGAGHRARWPRSADRLVPLARQHRRRDHTAARRRAPADAVRRWPGLCRRRSRHDQRRHHRRARSAAHRLHPRCARALHRRGPQHGDR